MNFRHTGNFSCKNVPNIAWDKLILNNYLLFLQNWNFTKCLIFLFAKSGNAKNLYSTGHLGNHKGFTVMFQVKALRISCIHSRCSINVYWSDYIMVIVNSYFWSLSYLKAWKRTDINLERILTIRQPQEGSFWLTLYWPNRKSWPFWESISCRGWKALQTHPTYICQVSNLLAQCLNITTSGCVSVCVRVLCVRGGMVRGRGQERQDKKCKANEWKTKHLKTFSSCYISWRVNGFFKGLSK